MAEKVEQLAATSQPSTGIYGDEHLKLLSKRAFDAQQLQDDIESYSPEQSEAGFISDVTDVDGFITRQLDTLIWNQINESTGRTPINALDHLIMEKESAWNEREMAKGKSEFMESLGQGQHGSMGGIGGRDDASTGAMLRAGRPEPAFELDSFGRRGAVGMHGAGRAAGDQAFYYGAPMTPLAKGHAAIVRKIALSQRVRYLQGESGVGVRMNQIDNSRGGATDRKGGELASVGSGGRGGVGNRGHEGRSTANNDSSRTDLDNDTAYSYASHLDPTAVPGVTPVRRPARELADLVTAAASNDALSNEDRLSRSDLEGYQDMMLMLSAIIDESKQTPPNPGAYSAICYDADASRSAGKAVSEHAHLARRQRLALTMGCKRHLEYQMREIWSDFVDTAVQSGQMMPHTSVKGQSGRQRLRSYVCIHDQMGLLGEQSARMKNPRDNMTPVWPFVYHCLRVGDLEGAEEELVTCASAGLHVEEAILVVIRLFRGIIAQLDRTSNAPGGVGSALHTSREVLPSSLLSSLEKADLDKALYKCRDLCEEEEQKADELRNSYRLFILNLVSLTDVDSLLHPSPEIEHYLWGALWFVQWEGLLKLCGYDTISHDSLDNGEAALYEKFLAEGGEKYFDVPDDPQPLRGGDGPPTGADIEPFSPFVYAKVLLCCQRYGDAVEYLWRKQQGFAAVHLMVVCLHYGLILPHRKLTENPRYVGAGGSAIFSASQMNRVPTPATLFRQYTTSPFSLDYPEEACDYLMCLNSCWAAGLQSSRSCINPDPRFWEAERIASETVLAQEFTHLLVSLHRPQLTKLCGEVRCEDAASNASSMASTGREAKSRSSDANVGTNRSSNSASGRNGRLSGRSRGRDPQGPALEYVSRRSRGYLDTHIVDPALVDHLLCRAAYMLLIELHNPENGIYLYQLAGRYADVITELMNQLSELAVPPRHASQRAFWKDMAMSFFNKHLKRGTGPVVLLLEEEEQLGLVKAFETLLSLCGFFDLVSEGKFRDALSLVDSMDIVPKTTEDVQRLVFRVKELDSCLRKGLDALLLQTMECTYQVYLRHKDEKRPTALKKQSGSKQEVQDQVQQGREYVFHTLKARSQALVRFACDISSMLKPDTPTRLSQIDIDML